MTGRARINETVFEANTADTSGGAIDASGGRFEFEDARFEANEAVVGGAVSAEAVTKFIETRFARNTASGEQAAILDLEDAGSLDGVTFEDHQAVGTINATRFGDVRVASSDSSVSGSNLATSASPNFMAIGSDGSATIGGDALGNRSLTDLSGSETGGAVSAGDDLLVASATESSSTRVEGYDADNRLAFIGAVDRDDVTVGDSGDSEDLVITLEGPEATSEVTLVGLGGRGLSSVSDINDSNLGDVFIGSDQWVLAGGG